MAATFTPTENEVFDALWGWIASLFDVGVQDNIFKGFQNATSTPFGSYIVIQPGQKIRQDQATRDYVREVDPRDGFVNIWRHTTYSYQVDCYGQNGADWADIISIAWRSLWACDALTDAAITPLYANEPAQLNVVNGELQYEQRFMLTLFMQVNQCVTLPQDFFVDPVPTEIIVADALPIINVP